MSYRKSDSIFGMYGKFPFLSVSSDFCLLVVFRVKIRPKDRQFSPKNAFLGFLLENILGTTTLIFVIVGQYVDNKDIKQTQKTGSQNLTPFLRIPRSKLAKIDKIGHQVPHLLDDPKIFEK